MPEPTSEENESAKMQSFEKWYEQFNDIDHTVSIIIRGHLLLEETINEYLRLAVPNPSFLERFQFRQKVKIMRGLSASYGLDESCEKYWKLIDLLTDLRNNAAHKSHDSNSEERAEIIGKIMVLAESMHPNSDKNIPGAFASASSFLSEILYDKQSSLLKQEPGETPGPST
jgi:hypothetical protein